MAGLIRRELHEVNVLSPVLEHVHMISEKCVYTSTFLTCAFVNFLEHVHMICGECVHTSNFKLQPKLSLCVLLLVLECSWLLFLYYLLHSDLFTCSFTMLKIGL